jgi:hypothetical protein
MTCITPIQTCHKLRQNILKLKEQLLDGMVYIVKYYRFQERLLQMIKKALMILAVSSVVTVPSLATTAQGATG